MIHELKTWAPYFEMMRSAVKSFELRKDDRGFKVGDILVLQEYEPGNPGRYTGRSVRVGVAWILRNAPEWGLEDGYCIMQTELLGAAKREKA